MPSMDVARPYSHPQGRANPAPCWGSCTNPGHGLFTLTSCFQAWPRNELCSQCLQGSQAPVPGSTHGFLAGQSLCICPWAPLSSRNAGQGSGDIPIPLDKMPP